MEISDSAYRRELGNGLVLRWSQPADTEALVDVFSQVFREAADHPPNPFMGAWIRQNANGHNPLPDSQSFALVEDTRNGGIAAAAGLLAATWSYDGIPFTIGRPEPVATAPDYRNRGLVRAIFELLHARSAARGDLVQAITGIPYFYRLFGYEYALEMSAPRSIYFSAIPQLKAGTPEPYSLRPAGSEDLPQLIRFHERELDEAYGEPLLVRSHFEPAYWRYLIDGIDPQAATGWQPLLIVDAAGRSCGYVLRWRLRWNEALGISGLMVEPGLPLAAALPSILRAIQASWAEVTPAQANTPAATHIRLFLGRNHGVSALLSDTIATPQQLPYAWYIRVADLPAFLVQVAPALEQRLAASVLSGYSGELRLTFYRGGLRLVFAAGRLTCAEPWREPQWEPKAQGGFPPEVFLQLLFGYRSLAELRHAFPDVWIEEEQRPLIETLFPRRSSYVLPQS